VEPADNGKQKLSYKIAPIPGQSVSFVERGTATAQAIGDAVGTSGSLTFEPGDGIKGERKIVALVTQDDLPRTTLEVAHYSVASRTLPGLPSGLRADRLGPDLHVSWSPATRSIRYAVSVQLDDGRHRVFSVPADRRQLTIPGVFPDAKGTISVAGLLRDNTPGPHAVLGLGARLAAKQSGTAWVGPAAAGGGALAVLGVGAAVARRRRRRPTA
jgi:MYXO-CTERM domain-containing protein